ncbi:uncharacterized protein PpBr36_06382 [Pyricularia pennisetigena]|uniref:uncharacterized protein n=1 Tax=Pyricularia pennisetigena TaxID=1578925 RepID=UPI00114F6E7A|nr:uncharacterized protein PpBr36_06382 [Pyricularia pennisetigena]TLS23028.1 hypothetical protein PpBr36_06382 [Pyricularia pennisetigena]
MLMLRPMLTEFQLHARDLFKDRFHPSQCGLLPHVKDGQCDDPNPGVKQSPTPTPPNPMRTPAAPPRSKGEE